VQPGLAPWRTIHLTFPPNVILELCNQHKNAHDQLVKLAGYKLNRFAVIGAVKSLGKNSAAMTAIVSPSDPL
jgi:hypothetical protein